MRSWKTTALGVLTVAVYLFSYIFPEHREFLSGLVPLCAAAGLITAKDYNVSGKQ